MVSVCFVHFLARIYCCIVGAGWVGSSAMDVAESFLLRSGRGVECSVNMSDVSLCCTFTPLRTMGCSFLFFFRSFLDPFVSVVVCQLVRVEFGSGAVL